mgnify:FL=1
MSGLRSAAASGATTLGQTGFMRIDNSNGPQFASINGYDGITAATLDATYVAATPDASAMRVVRLHNRRATRHNRHY